MRIQERIKIDNRTRIYADKQDLKYTELTDESSIIFYRGYIKRGFREHVYEIAMMLELIFGTKREVKRKAVDFLRKSA